MKQTFCDSRPSDTVPATDLGFGERCPGSQSPHRGTNALKGLAGPGFPPPPAHSLSFPWLFGSEQGTLQLAHQPPGVGSNHAPLVPLRVPGELLQQAQPRDMSDSHVQTSNQLLHSSSPRPSQKAQSWPLGLKTLQHRAALFPGSAGAGG